MAAERQQHLFQTLIAALPLNLADAIVGFGLRGLNGEPVRGSGGDAADAARLPTDAGRMLCGRLVTRVPEPLGLGAPFYLLGSARSAGWKWGDTL